MPCATFLVRRGCSNLKVPTIFPPIFEGCTHPPVRACWRVPCEPLGAESFTVDVRRRSPSTFRHDFLPEKRVGLSVKRIELIVVGYTIDTWPYIWERGERIVPSVRVNTEQTIVLLFDIVTADKRCIFPSLYSYKLMKHLCQFRKCFAVHIVVARYEDYVIFFLSWEEHLTDSSHLSGRKRNIIVRYY